MTEDDPYADPALYDLEYADHTEDITYYQRLAIGAGGPILELGCGTGRLTLPMIRMGARVDGVDLARTMLEGLRLKVAALDATQQGRVRFYEADFRELPDHLRTDYTLIIWPFNALHHCRDERDVERTLAGAVSRLAPGGTVALDVYLPDRQLYDRDPSKTYEHRIFKDPRSGLPLHTWEQGWWDEASRTHHVVYTYKHRNGTLERAHLALRMFERDELEAIFAKVGLRVVQEAEDFEGTPTTPTSLKWVIRLQRA
ncbi:MAG: class I SAM-dependent methyltransferase [Myxococcales bacterium]|nr:class I SAM-dependent methyltransferase [Myxococcales bacterium]MCB9668911.1 class I SAM-dependent methyltransferase [Alphaproteobacteria bacterium]MCB9691237.1 class I SAM-dependent methyltransferase [Alphaproteobacteria bacterium]